MPLKNIFATTTAEVGLAITAALAETPKTENTAPKPATVTVQATDEKAGDVIERAFKDSGARILVEKNAADVKVSVSVSDLPVEDALTAICKAGEIEWRMIYVKADSPLLKKPESLASTVRLMAALQFPDMLIEKTSKPENLVHVANKPAVDAIPISLRKDMGMVSVYLVTNDEAAKKATDKANSNVEKYKKLSKEAMDLFMKMTPEEREQAMASGIEQMQQYDPKYMAEMSNSVLKNPDLMQRIMQTQSSFIMQMSAEDRRALIRAQMQAQQFMPPELMKLLQEDAIAVMKEMGKLPPDFQPPPPQQ